MTDQPHAAASGSFELTVESGEGTEVLRFLLRPNQVSLVVRLQCGGDGLGREWVAAQVISPLNRPTCRKAQVKPRWARSC